MCRRAGASGWGEILLQSKDVSHFTIAQRIQRGLVLVPEDRQRDGLVPTLSVGRNLSLASINTFTRKGITSSGLEKGMIASAIDKVHIKTDGGEADIGSLSGGNQQKVVIGKMLATNPDVLYWMSQAVVLMWEPKQKFSNC